MLRQRVLGHSLVCLVAAVPLGLVAAVPRQAQVAEPAPETAGKLERVIGVVTATNPAAKQITVKVDAGGTVTVILQDQTLYLRVPPGETDLKHAAKITPAEIGVGDRVLVRGRLAEEQKSIPAVAVIVMTKADLTKKRERELAEWQKRAVAGTISALNPATQEITLSVRSREGTKTFVIEPSQTAVFRRYAPDSVRFGQAKPSSFAELKVGDSLRILGDKNSDGTRIKPEEIVSGSFRNLAGIINAIDAAGGEIKMTDLKNNQLLTVRITPDTMVRRMPPTKTATPANRPQEGGRGTAAAAGAGSGGRPTEGPPQGKPSGEGGRGTAAAGGAGSGGRPTEGPPQGKPPGEGGRGSAAAGSAGSGAAGGGLMNIERMPVLSLGEVKRGDAIIVLCTIGAEPSRVTAIVMVAGVEPLLGAAPEGQAQLGGVWNFFDVSLP